MAVPALGPKHKLGSVWDEGRKYHSQLRGRKPAPWAGQALAWTKEASQQKSSEERQEFLPCPAPIYPSSASPVNKEQTFKLTMIDQGPPSLREVRTASLASMTSQPGWAYGVSTKPSPGSPTPFP